MLSFPRHMWYTGYHHHALGKRANMGILIIRKQATPSDIAEMRTESGSFIKLAVDLEREILAGGGELHADCEQALLLEGSKQNDIWGGDWFPDLQEVGFESLINIRPRQGNRGLELESPELKKRFEAIVRNLLEVK
jgi:hypothetical protein